MKIKQELLDHPDTDNIIMIPKMAWFVSHDILRNYKIEFKSILTSMKLTLWQYSHPQTGLNLPCSKKDSGEAFLRLNEHFGFITLYGFSLCLHIQFMQIWSINWIAFDLTRFKWKVIWSTLCGLSGNFWRWKFISMKMQRELLDHPDTDNIIMIPKMAWLVSHVKLCNVSHKLFPHRKAATETSRVEN